MSNIKENTKTDNVQMHIDKAYKFLDRYLPNPYVPKTEDYLKNKGQDISRSTINNVRNRNNERLDVLNALLIIAKQNKAQVEELKSLVKS